MHKHWNEYKTLNNRAMDKLIIKHLAFDTTSLDFASVKYFAETGQITGNLLIRVRAMLKEASEGKNSNENGALPIPDVSKNEAVIFCENEFSTCIHQSFDKCTLKEKCPSQKMKAK